MDIKRILLPYNFTNLDKKTLEFVSQTFSHLKGVGVTLLNVYTSAPNITMKDSPAMRKMQESRLFGLLYNKKVISKKKKEGLNHE